MSVRDELFKIDHHETLLMLAFGPKHGLRQILESTMSPNRFPLLRYMSEVHDRIGAEHKRLQPQGGAIPVGGAHMDPFFKMEAVLAFMTAYRKGATVTAALERAKAASAEAVDKWNKTREYQVHRWRETAWAWIEQEVYSHAPCDGPYPDAKCSCVRCEWARN